MRSLGCAGSSPVQRLAHCKTTQALDLVIPDQFIDRTQGVRQLFGEGAVATWPLPNRFAPPFGPLRRCGTAVLPEGRRLHRGGTYLCMQGPAFSTKAESELYRSWGCDVIGMTNHTEARLAAKPKSPTAPWRWSPTTTAGTPITTPSRWRW